MLSVHEEKKEIVFNQEATAKLRLALYTASVKNISDLLAQGADPSAAQTILTISRQLTFSQNSIVQNIGLLSYSSMPPAQNKLRQLEELINAYGIFYYTLKNPNKTLNEQIEKIAKLKIESSYQDERYTAINIIKEDSENLSTQLNKNKIYFKQYIKDDFVIILFYTNVYGKLFNDYLQEQSSRNSHQVQLEDAGSEEKVSSLSRW